MAEIKLKAKLQAYSRTPIYNDYIRNVIINPDGTTTPLEPDVSYVWQGNRWEKMDFGNINDLGNRVDSAEKKIDSNSQALSRIEVKPGAKAGTLTFIDSKGDVHNIDVLPNTFVDNTTIKINDDNEISLMHPWDDLTIKLNKDTGKMEVTGIIIGGEVISGDDFDYGIKTDFQNVDNKITQIKADIELTNKKLEDIAAYVNDGGAGTALPPVRFELKDESTGAVIKVLNGSLVYSSADPDPSLESEWIAIQTFLTEYAIKELNRILNEDKEPSEQIIITKDNIPNNIRVQDEISGFLWVYSTDDGMNEWLNNGKDLVVSATNNGIFGVVTGSEWVNNENEFIPKDATFTDEWESYKSYLQGHISEEEGKVPDPTFTLNGLAERLKDLDRSKVERIDNRSGDFDVVYTQSKGTDYDNDEERSFVNSLPISAGNEYEKNDSKYNATIVKRTPQGRIKAQQPLEGDDVINADWFTKQYISDDEYSSIVAQLTRTKYESDFINNDNDVTDAPDFMYVEAGYETTNS